MERLRAAAHGDTGQDEADEVRGEGQAAEPEEVDLAEEADEEAEGAPEGEHEERFFLGLARVENIAVAEEGAHDLEDSLENLGQQKENEDR